MFGRRPKDQPSFDEYVAREDARLRAQYHQVARENAAQVLKEARAGGLQITSLEYCQHCRQPARCVWMAVSVGSQTCFCWLCPSCQERKSAG